MHSVYILLHNVDKIISTRSSIKMGPHTRIYIYENGDTYTDIKNLYVCNILNYYLKHSGLLLHIFSKFMEYISVIVPFYKTTVAICQRNEKCR